ncbi:MAG: hypothetical protein NXY57DRAFT_892287 [Lentinula lateritia]|nr:MAG: hypothetical protein NXY57DRAFT_892287 [Lentinula lateritia]
MLSLEISSNEAQFIVFELHGTDDIEPSEKISVKIPSSGLILKYTLSSIIYHGSSHFSARVFNSSGVWLYDGQINEGKFIFECSIDEKPDRSLNILNNRKAHMYIYTYVQ